MPISPLFQDAFAAGDLRQLLAVVGQVTPQATPDGGQYLAEVVGSVDCVRYTDQGIAFEVDGLQVSPPQADEVLILTTSVSLCGTDLDLIKKAQAGALPSESKGRVVGHEAAGIVVGVGGGVGDWQIGQLVCLDSHFACQQPEHRHFDDCVHSGESCDGIVGGIRGAVAADGHQRQQPRDGYWSRVITVPASALPVPLSPAVAEALVAPSTLESLGNIYMIMNQLVEVGLVESAGQSILVVSGLGATGYPLAAVGSHTGYQVWGINPSAGKRAFAEQVGVCQQTFAETSDLVEPFQTALATGQAQQLIIAVMVGDPQALEQALAVLNDPSLAAAQRRAVVVFGLYADAQAQMPGMPAEKSLPQRDFVFSRQHFTTEAGVEVYGVCGRDLESWERLMADLSVDESGKPPALVNQLNQAVYSLATADPLRSIAETLNAGPAAVTETLRQHQALKLAANFLVAKSTE